MQNLNLSENISKPEIVMELVAKEKLAEKEQTNPEFCDFGNGLASLCIPKK